MSLFANWPSWSDHFIMTAADAERTDGRPGPIRRFLPLALIVIGAAAFFAFGGGEYLSLSALDKNRDVLQAWTAESPILAACIYLLIYIASTALSLPLGTLLTFTGGFIFGTWLGGALTTVGATIGATILFVAARTAFGDYFRDRMGSAVQKMREKFQENEFSYILALRLAPIFPFVVVNVAPALAGAKLRNFVIATAIGIIPGTFVYASVGAGLDAIFAAGGKPDAQAIFQWEVIGPLILLAGLALAPTIWKQIKRRRDS